MLVTNTSTRILNLPVVLQVRVFVAGEFPQREKSTTSMDYFRATKKSNYSTTKRLEWPDAGLFKNNKRPNMSNL